MADADTFWTWTFDGLFQLWKEGWPKRDLPKRDLKEKPVIKKGPATYDDEFLILGGLGRGYDAKLVAARLLTRAVVELVRNPTADLRPARLGAQLLNERHDQNLAPQLVKMLGEAKAIRERAVAVMAQLDDPALIQPLISALGGKAAVPGAAAALKQITGQDHADNIDAWKAWWQENRKTLQEMHAVRKKERAGEQVTVAVITGGKLYHLDAPGDERPACPDLQRASLASGFSRILLQVAREKRLQPCPKCNPTK